MKKLIIALLLAMTVLSCSTYAGVGVGRGGVRGNVGVWF